ncbi:MAG: HEPN domain-containing protein [Nitrospirae bacterium]|nr:MAG: HEPN domain-containing protein [Nitrospirota bacterium]
MRAKEWIEQAKRTVTSAEHSASGGFYEDACFLAHHGALLGAISLATRKGLTETGSSVYYILKRTDSATREVLHSARVLDTLYLPSRFPYCFEKGTPKDYFDEETAKEAIGHAKAILGFVEEELG